MKRVIAIKSFEKKVRRGNEEGPYRFAPERILEIFGARLSGLSIKETVYQGAPGPLPRALFCAMRKQKTESKESLQRMTELTEDAGLYDE
jgi:hypothetical protein